MLEQVKYMTALIYISLGLSLYVYNQEFYNISPDKIWFLPSFNVSRAYYIL